MNDVKAMIRFIMEDLMDFRRRLPYADYLEEIGCHKAAARQREFVTMCERAKGIELWHGFIKVITQNGKCLIIRRKNVNVNPENIGSKDMIMEHRRRLNRLEFNRKMHKRNIYRQHCSRSATVDDSETAVTWVGTYLPI